MHKHLINNYKNIQRNSHIIQYSLHINKTKKNGIPDKNTKNVKTNKLLSKQERILRQ